MDTTFNERLTGAIPGLTSYAMFLTRDRAHADDLVQDTLERALTRRSLYVETGSFLGWLKTIMQNLFFDRMRARKRQEPHDGPQPGPTEDCAAINPSQEDRRFLRELAALLERLPRRDGEIIMAVGVKGYSYRQVAHRFNVRPGTVASRLSRARVALLQAVSMAAAASGAGERTSRRPSRASARPP